MAEKENAWSMIKLGLVLCAYAVVACALLALPLQPVASHTTAATNKNSQIVS